jgi:Protein of unknown function (DUF2806)
VRFAGNSAGTAQQSKTDMPGEIIRIGDLAGLRKPLTRLIEVISAGVGAVTTPYLIRKTAEARAYEIKTIAGALQEVSEQAAVPVVYQGGVVEVWQKPEDGTLVVTSGPIDERSASRRNYQDRKRQENIEKITSITAAELAEETTVPEQAPDEDWISRFFSEAENVTSKEMQELWGRILAGEIRHPGSFSLRTLQFVKNITKREAELFEFVGRLALRKSEISFIPTFDKSWLEEKRELYPIHQFTLAELGIMYPGDLTLKCFTESRENEFALIGGSYLVHVKRGKIAAQIKLPIWKFTDVGRELLELVRKERDDEYLEKVGSFFVTNGGEAIIGTIKEQFSDGKISYGSEKEVQINAPVPALPEKSTSDPSAS